MRKLLVSSLALLMGWSLSAAFMYESTMTVSGYEGSETLAGFPVLVRLSAGHPEGFSYPLCQADGKDIQFLAPDGETVYPHEIEKWDASGESLVWVRMPELSGTSTQFLFRFGDASVTEAPSAKSTWASSADVYYAGVWHFGDTVTTGSEVAKDSAQHDAAVNLDLTPKGSTAYAQATTGVVGLGRQATTKSTDAVYYETKVTDYSSLNIAPNMTVSGWFRYNSLIDAYTSTSQFPLLGRGSNLYGDGGAWMLVMQGLNTGLNRYNARLFGSSATPRADPIVPRLDDHEWFHLSLAFSSSGVSVYTNGVLSLESSSFAVAGNNSLQFRIGWATAANAFFGDCDEIRMLNVSASADWVKAEFDSAANADFVTAEPVQSLVSDALFIESSGERIGTVTPGYGQYAGALSDGTVIACSADTALVDVTETLKSGIRGWKLYGQDKDDNTWTNISAGTENSCTYVHVGGENRKLEWQVVNMRPVTLSASRSVTYTINGETAQAGVNWVREGEEVEITVACTSGVEGEDYAFAGWTGDVGGSQGTDSQTLKLTVTGPITLVARYQNLHFVSAEKGSDETGDGSRDNPWASINFAIANAATYDGDEIRIAGGTYVEQVSIDKRRLTIRGGYRTDWTRDLAGCPTVITLADPGLWSSRKDIVTMTVNAVSNRLDGLTICGGANGVRVKNYYGQRFDKLIVTNNLNGVTFDWCKLYSQHGGDVVISSCCLSYNGDPKMLAYGNSAAGLSISDSDALVSGFHLLNCTIVSNGTYGVTTARHEMYVLNCLIADNGWEEGALKSAPADFNYGTYGAYQTRMRHTDVWNSRPGRGIQLWDSDGHDLNKYKLWNPVALVNVDPCVNPNGGLGTDSPLIGFGEDLSDYRFPVTEDALGRSWAAGAYDVGCFKAEVAKAKPAKLSDVYVAADGDDLASGADEAHALRSVGLAERRLSDGGTLHVAAGAYDEFFTLNVPEMTLVGAGPDATVFAATAAANSFGAYVGGPGITVKGIAVENVRFGIQIANQHAATNALVENCRLSGNRFGFFQFAEGTAIPGYPGLSVPVMRFSHLTVVSNSFGAGYVGNLGAPFVCDSCLFAHNGGLQASYGGPYSSAAKDHYYNCTFASNANYAVFSDNGGNSARDTKFYNCIMVGSPIGWKCNGHYGWGAYCIFDCAQNYAFNSLGYWQSGKTNDLYEVTAPLQWTDGEWAHPIPDSLAAKGGKNFNGTGTLLYDVTTDLDYVTGSSRKWFIGCYAPERPGLMILIK